MIRGVVSPNLATENSNEPCSCPRSRDCTPLTAAPTTTENAPNARSTTPPSSAAHGPGEIWGVRADESPKGSERWSLYYNALSSHVTRDCDGCCTSTTAQRRHHGGLIERADGTRVLGPMWDWSVDEIWAYIAHHQLPVNPVYDKLRQLSIPEQHLRVSHMIDDACCPSLKVPMMPSLWLPMIGV